MVSVFWVVPKFIPIPFFSIILGQFGGLVGLCIGFSLLSVIEFCYWFSLRLWHDERIRENAKLRFIEDIEGKDKLD